MALQMLWIGIDMAKATFEAGWWQCDSDTDEGGVARALGHFSNDAAGWDQWAAQVRARAQQTSAAVVHVVVEPTGGYEQGLVAFVHAQGWRLSLPNPKQVRDWAKGVGQRAKTDRQDSLLLTRYGARHRPPALTPLPAAVQQLESLLARRDDLELMVRQERNRLAALPYRPQASPAVAHNVDHLLGALQQAIVEIEQAIAQLLDQHPDLRDHARRLQSVPGVGPKNVLYLLVLLYRWQAMAGRQGNAKGLVALVGLDPVPYQSGSSVHRRPRTSGLGNRLLRRRLFMGALGGVRGHNPLRDFYARLVGRHKPKMVALIAASRKIVVWSWAVFRDQVVFDHARFAAEP